MSPSSAQPGPALSQLLPAPGRHTESSGWVTHCQTVTLAETRCGAEPRWGGGHVHTSDPWLCRSPRPLHILEPWAFTKQSALTLQVTVFCRGDFLVNRSIVSKEEGRLGKHTRLKHVGVTHLTHFCLGREEHSGAHSFSLSPRGYSSTSFPHAGPCRHSFQGF